MNNLDGNNQYLELSQGFIQLKKEIDALTKEYSILWEEKENIVHLIQPELILKYNLSIGKYVLLYLNKNLELLQLKRKIEMIQSNINRNLKVDIKQVEELVKKEYKEWYDKIYQLNEEIQISNNAELVEINGSDFQKIQELYRKLVKKLHPDINRAVDFPFFYQVIIYY